MKKVFEPFPRLPGDGLEGQANLLAGSLTLGAKKKLELARVLAAEPKLMLLDEVMEA